MHAVKGFDRKLKQDKKMDYENLGFADDADDTLPKTPSPTKPKKNRKVFRMGLIKDKTGKIVTHTSVVVATKKKKVKTSEKNTNRGKR